MKQEPRPRGARSRQFVPPFENSRFSKRTLLALTQNLFSCRFYIPKVSSPIHKGSLIALRSRRAIHSLCKTFSARVSIVNDRLIEPGGLGRYMSGKGCYEGFEAGHRG